MRIMQNKGITEEGLEMEFRENYSRYFYYALSLVDDVDTAKDIISEVFMHVWKKRNTIGSAKLGQYLFTSIHNTCLKRINDTKRFPRVEETLAMTQIPDDGGEEWKRRESRIVEMEQVIGAMPPRTRYILEQFYYKKRSYKDIAAEVGITTDGIKKQLVKALTILRTHFNIIKHRQ